MPTRKHPLIFGQLLAALALVTSAGCGFDRALDRAFNGPRPTLPSKLEKTVGRKYAESWVWLVHRPSTLQYHRHSCPYVDVAENPWNVTLEYARSRGYRPCGYCNAPR